MSFFRIPQPSVEWSKTWADRLVSTVELYFTQVSETTKDSARSQSDSQVWILG